LQETVDHDTDNLYVLGMADRDPRLIEAWNAAGGAKVLAAHLGIRVSAVYQWKRVPAERVRDVAAATGLAPHRLRPDLYDDPDAAPHHAAASAPSAASEAA
jgi:DNA-binding transcriptional regulator YdaS (Cro superfamily)